MIFKRSEFKPPKARSIAFGFIGWGIIILILVMCWINRVMAGVTTGFFLGFWCLLKSINGLRTGVANVKFGTTYYRSNNPYNFWATIISQLFISIVSFYAIFYLATKRHSFWFSIILSLFLSIFALGLALYMVFRIKKDELSPS